MSIHRHTTDYNNNEQNNPYWLSISDVMSGLLLIFILACVALLVTFRNAEHEALQRIQDIKEKAKVETTIKNDVRLNIKRIQDDLRKQNIFVEIDDKNTIHIPPETINFATGSSKIPEGKEKDALIIGKRIFDYVQKVNYLDTIFIEGHTDSRRFNGEYGNWNLSAERAISIWINWYENLCKTNLYQCNEMKNIDNDPLFSVSGYADQRPQKNTIKLSDEERWQKNRRIDIRFVHRIPEQKKILEDLFE